MNKTVYIIIYTTAIGGAEKRFSEIWLEFQKLGYENIKLVLPKELYNNLLKNAQLQEISIYVKNVIFITRINNGYLKKRKILIEFINKYNQPNSVFHFISIYPIFGTYFNNYQTILTYTSTTFIHKKRKSLAIVFLSFLETKSIDILDPRLTIFSKKLFWFKKNNIFNTPGSFVNTDYYTNISYENKKNWLVFLGRFIDIKQVMKLVTAIPTIQKKLISEGITNHKFILLGYGILENDIRTYIRTNNDFINIDIEIYFEDKPIKILSQSKIFFSLQKYSNYPSKSLLEGIICGNLPIVTDNGDTRKIAQESFSFYVKENFSKNEIANQCVKILKMDEKSFLNKSINAKEYIKNNFSIDYSIKYFLNLYGLNKC